MIFILSANQTFNIPSKQQFKGGWFPEMKINNNTTIVLNGEGKTYPEK